MHVYPEPKKAAFTGGEWTFPGTVTLTVPAQYADKRRLALFAEMYRNFTGGVGRLRTAVSHAAVSSAVLALAPAEPEKADVGANDYTLTVRDGRADLYFSDGRAFSHAFCTLLKLLEVRATKGGGRMTLPLGIVEDAPALAFRALHLCVFPESPYGRMRRLVRLAGLLGYSHIVLEFWGMFPYRTERAFGRRAAYTRRQIRRIAADAAALGAEIVPMLNIYGHASQNRVGRGKHTVLDRHPQLAPYFETNGWNWNLANPDTMPLQKRLIGELLDVCGAGGYFCIGCDEAYDYAGDRIYAGRDATQILIDHINGIAAFLKARGRTPIMWADMLLCGDRFAGSVQCGADPETCERLLNGLNKNIILADWQYWTKDGALPTARFLAGHGFRIVTAPWEDRETAVICLKNVEEHGYFGFMQTTWQALFRNIELLPQGAVYAWDGSERAASLPLDCCMTIAAARYLRGVMRVRRYKEEGISDGEIDY